MKFSHHILGISLQSLFRLKIIGIGMSRSVLLFLGQPVVVICEIVNSVHQINSTLNKTRTWITGITNIHGLTWLKGLDFIWLIQLLIMIIILLCLSIHYNSTSMNKVSGSKNIVRTKILCVENKKSKFKQEITRSYNCL